MERLALLFEALERLTGVADIAYHEIREGRLNPVLKTKTDHLGVERWKSVHAQNPVYIEHDRLLRELMAHPQTAAVVQDVKNDPRSADEFFSVRDRQHHGYSRHARRRGSGYCRCRLDRQAAFFLRRGDRTCGSTGERIQRCVSTLG